ncbi:hypothetical protein [Spiroplasma endosymbiont of Cleonymus obscurus]|uniref:hypothetical protein n=1 Tax=Spiroplasma endosymbiont of Cleonymus obscurus TaxID=3066324 RepID=UPI0037DC3B73
MYSKVKKIKSIYKLIAEIKEEIKLPEGFEERKMYHAWVQEPLCNVLDTTWYHEIDIKIQNIEKRLKNNINKYIGTTSLATTWLTQIIVAVGSLRL